MTEENPSHLKLDYLKRFAVGEVLVETGTYKSDTVRLALEYAPFKHIHTIELDKDLYEAAAELWKDEPRVTCHFGDSVDWVPKILEMYPNQELTIFLDAHASGPLGGGKTGRSPIIEELREIAGANLLVFRNGAMVAVRPEINTHTIFIDDRRLFGTPDWDMVPEGAVMDLLTYINPAYNLVYLDGHEPGDVICVTTRDGTLPEDPAPEPSPVLIPTLVDPALGVDEHVEVVA